MSFVLLIKKDGVRGGWGREGRVGVVGGYGSVFAIAVTVRREACACVCVYIWPPRYLHLWHGQRASALLLAGSGSWELMILLSCFRPGLPANPPSLSL